MAKVSLKITDNLAINSVVRWGIHIGKGLLKR